MRSSFIDYVSASVPNQFLISCSAVRVTFCTQNLTETNVDVTVNSRQPTHFCHTNLKEYSIVFIYKFDTFGLGEINLIIRII